MPSIIIIQARKYFYDANNQMINKIKVTATRDSEPVLKGLYSWAIMADLDIKGYRMKEELDVMTLKQNFGYNKNNKIWAKTHKVLILPLALLE
jgi:hypothetical protein